MKASPTTKSRKLPRWPLVCLSLLTVVPVIYTAKLAHDVASVGSSTTYSGRDLVETPSYQVNRQAGDDDSATDYLYTVVQQPGAIISGRPVAFAVTVTKMGQPVVEHQFKAGIAHAYGMFIDARASDVTSATYITDTSGRFSLTYQSRFWSLRPDRGFGFNITPILTTAEKEQMHDRQAAGKLATNPNIGISFDTTIYPRWLGYIFR